MQCIPGVSKAGRWLIRSSGTSIPPSSTDDPDFYTSNRCICTYCIVQLVCGSYEPLLQSSYHSICNAKLSNKSFAFLSWCVKCGYSRAFLKSGPFSRKLNRPKKASRPSILGGYPHLQLSLSLSFQVLIRLRHRLSAKIKQLGSRKAVRLLYAHACM